MSSWLGQFDKANNKADDAQASIAARQRCIKNGESSSKVTSQCRRHLNELAADLTRLEDALNEAGNKHQVTDAEFSRRQNQLSTLKGRCSDLQSKFGRGIDANESGSGMDNQRNALFGGRESGTARRPYQDEPESFRGNDQDGIMQSQRQVMREQDQGLDMISQSVSRIKNMGLKIGDEIEDQNEMLDDLNDGMDRTNERLLKETDHVKEVTDKAKAGGYCCCIFLLVVAIIVVGVAL